MQKYILISKLGEQILDSWNDKELAKKDAEELKHSYGPILICEVVEEIENG